MFSAIQQIFLNLIIVNENVFFRYLHIRFKITLVITGEQEFTNQIGILDNIHMEKQQVVKRVFHNVSTKLFRKLDCSLVGINYVVIFLLANGAVKPFVRSVKHIFLPFHVLQNFVENSINFEKFDS